MSSTKSSRKPPPPLKIRLAVPADAERLQSLIHTSYRGGDGWTTEAHIVVGSRLTIEEAHALLSDPQTNEREPVFVAELDEPDAEGRRLIGCIQPSRGKGGSRSSHANGRVASKEPHTEIATTPNGTHETEILLVPAIPEVLQPPPSPSATPSHTKDSEYSTSAMFGLFAVHPSYQSSGIGSLLVQKALSHMRTVWHCKTCILWVLENRPELLAWYEKIGFKWNGVTRPFVFPEYLKEKVDFRILELEM